MRPATTTHEHDRPPRKQQQQQQISSDLVILDETKKERSKEIDLFLATTTIHGPSQPPSDHHKLAS